MACLVTAVPSSAVGIVVERTSHSRTSASPFAPIWWAGGQRKHKPITVAGRCCWVYVVLRCWHELSDQPVCACLQLLKQLSTHHAWLLGRLAEQYNTSRIEEPAALDTAACLLIHPLHAAECPAGTAARHLPQLTGQTLLDLEGLLQSHSVGSLKRLSGVFSFANIVWVLGAIGIALAFFPAIYPLLAMVAAALGPAAVLLLQILQPWYGLFIYTGCWYIITFATK